MQEIFKYFISKDPNDDYRRVGYLMWFTDTFPASEFLREEKILKYYTDFSARLQVPMKSKYLESFLYTELEEILIRENIRVAGTELISFDNPSGLATALEITKEVIRDYFTQLESLENSVGDFKVAVHDFMQVRYGERLTECLTATFDTMNKTGSSFKAATYAQEQLSMLADIYTLDNIEDMEDEDGEPNQDRRTLTHMELITDFGIPVFDNDIHGIHRKQLGGLEAQPGAGKTRFALGVLIYRAATIFKQNCLFYVLEQDRVEIENMLIARHVYTLFNVQISDEMLNFNTVPEDLKPMVEAARLDLFESGKYGKITIKETVLYLETFIDKIKTIDRLKGPFDLIIIDYMSLIEQAPAKPGVYRSTLNDYQIVQRSYRWFKRYLRQSNKGGIAINQLNREGEDAGKADKDIRTNMAQGGMEVYRSTDWNLAMTFTQDQKSNNKRRFQQPKIRINKGFGTVLLDVRLGFCYFYQQSKAKI